VEPRVLTYEESGEGEPLVLYPGGLTGWLSWIPHAERLQDAYRVIRMQPIHNELGTAGQPGDPGYSIVTERESLRLTLDAMQLDRVDVAAWSSGGRGMIEFAIEYPQRVRTMTLVEPATGWVLAAMGEPDDAEESFLSDHAGHRLTEDDLADFLVLAGFADSTDAARVHPGWASWLEHRQALSWQSMALARPNRSLEDLALVGAPTLLVKGTDSAPAARRAVDILGDLLPNAVVLELPGDHAAHIVSIDRFLDEMRSHIEAAGPRLT
jgi:pimeloyl-ACP methyl ester carboxylesterase